MAKKLQPKEYLELELALRDVEVLELRAKLLESRKSICYLERDLLKSQCADKDRSAHQLLKEHKTVTTKIEKQKSKRNQVLERIKKRLKIDGGFGYDPDTLEVISD